MTSVSCTPGHPLPRHQAAAALILTNGGWGPLASQAAASLTPGAQGQVVLLPLLPPRPGQPPATPPQMARALQASLPAPSILGPPTWGLPEAPSTQGSEAPCEALPPPSSPHSSIVRSAPSAELRPEVCGGPGAGHGRLSPARLLPARRPPRPRMSVPFAHPCRRCGLPGPRPQPSRPRDHGAGFRGQPLAGDAGPSAARPCLCSRNLLRVQPWPQPRGPHRPAGGAGGHQRQLLLRPRHRGRWCHSSQGVRESQGRLARWGGLWVRLSPRAPALTT